MIKYLVQDLLLTLRYIPFVVIIGIVLVFVVKRINKKRQGTKKEGISLWSTVSFFTYLALVVLITFLSRESGSTARIDMELGASLRINARNNALVLENVLLFIPYGFFLNWWRGNKRRFFGSLFVGFTTSFIIEVLQLVTGRGIFQLDDIITNTMGCVLGALIFRLIYAIINKDKKKTL